MNPPNKKPFSTKLWLRKARRFIGRIIVDLKYERIFVLGDSHSKVFGYINHNFKLKQFFDVTHVGGATAMGMVNPNSKTDCLNIFQTTLKRASKHQKIIMLLGEVDTGFVIWYRAQKNGLSVESQFERSLENYFGFVDKLLAQGFENICLMSAPLPTILDNQGEYGEIANLRNEVKNSIEERTALTLRYNHRIAEFAESRKLKCLSLDAELLGADGIIASNYLNSDPKDHHCDHQAYSQLIVKCLTDMSWVKSAQ